jgi:hypothetical protein
MVLVVDLQQLQLQNLQHRAPTAERIYNFTIMIPYTSLTSRTGPFFCFLNKVNHMKHTSKFVITTDHTIPTVTITCYKYERNL